MPNALRLSSYPGVLPAFCRELELDVGWACRGCRLAFPTEASFHGHQRHCLNNSASTAIRLIQPHYECMACDVKLLPNATELDRHCDGDGHRGRISSATVSVATSVPCATITNSISTPRSMSPSLSHEMDDVVNQITLLAARAAAESQAAASIDSNANLSNKDRRDSGKYSSSATGGEPPAAVALSQ